MRITLKFCKPICLKRSFSEPIFVVLASILVPLFVMAPCDPAFGQESEQSRFLASQDASPLDYGTCPPPEAICYYYHGEEAEPTNYCTGFDCFEMTYFEQARAVAADEEGVFPRTFMAWLTDKTETPYTAWADTPCEVQSSGNKFKLKIPEGSTICGAGLMTPEAVYYWHAASNPVTGCLGIGECKQTIIFTPPSLNPSQGPVGTPITISDPQNRIEPGDVAVIYPMGGNPLEGTLCTEISITPDGGTLTASIPLVPTDMQYHVAVVSLSTGEIRFDQLGFYVTA